MKRTDLIKEGINFIEIEIPCNDFELSELPEELENTKMHNKKNGIFIITIDLNTKTAVDWEKNEMPEAYIFIKLVDGGSYRLLDADHKIVHKIKYGYVPKILDFDGDSFGDYLTLDINKKGKITNWKDVKFNMDDDEWNS